MGAIPTIEDRAMYDTYESSLILELFALGNPKQKAAATRQINKFLVAIDKTGRPGKKARKIQDWSWEERTSYLYRELLTDEQLRAVIAVAGYGV